MTGTKLPPFILFDLDLTLAESKEPLTPRMAALVAKLLARTKVGVVSGGALPQFLSQVVERLPKDADLAHLYLLPTSGAALYEYRSGAWTKIYEERISETDAAQIEAAIREGAALSGVVDPASKTWGPRVEYRGGQVTFSALGQDAPPAEKRAWDPTHAKRLALQGEIQKRLPKGFDARMGGSTSIDVSRSDVDKAYGIRKLAAQTGIPEHEMLYVGDELVAHGNDEAVFKTGIATHAVKDPADTEAFITRLLG